MYVGMWRGWAYSVWYLEAQASVNQEKFNYLNLLHCSWESGAVKYMYFSHHATWQLERCRHESWIPSRPCTPSILVSSRWRKWQKSLKQWGKYHFIGWLSINPPQNETDRPSFLGGSLEFWHHISWAYSGLLPGRNRGSWSKMTSENIQENNSKMLTRRLKCMMIDAA